MPRRILASLNTLRRTPTACEFHRIGFSNKKGTERITKGEIQAYLEGGLETNGGRQMLDRFLEYYEETHQEALQHVGEVPDIDFIDEEEETEMVCSVAFAYSSLWLSPVVSHAATVACICQVDFDVHSGPLNNDYIKNLYLKRLSERLESSKCGRPRTTVVLDAKDDSKVVARYSSMKLALIKTLKITKEKAKYMIWKKFIPKDGSPSVEIDGFRFKRIVGLDFAAVNACPLLVIGTDGNLIECFTQEVVENYKVELERSVLDPNKVINARIFPYVSDLYGCEVKEATVYSIDLDDSDCSIPPEKLPEHWRVEAYHYGGETGISTFEEPTTKRPRIAANRLDTSNSESRRSPYREDGFYKRNGVVECVYWIDILDLRTCKVHCTKIKCKLVHRLGTLPIVEMLVNNIPTTRSGDRVFLKGIRRSVTAFTAPTTISRMESIMKTWRTTSCMIIVKWWKARWNAHALQVNRVLVLAPWLGVCT